MPFTITKTFEFSAAHHLDHLPPGHPCARQHGHNYIVKVELAASTRAVIDSPQKWVKDYGDLKALKDFIDFELDHKDLNEVLTFDRTAIVDFTPTAEMLAYFLFSWCIKLWPEVIAVSVSETPKVWATYRAGNPIEQIEGVEPDVWTTS